MPYYQFLNEKTGDKKDIFFHMNDEKEYIENGEKWTRLFTTPNASIDTKINAFSSKDFVEKTKSKKGMTIGDAFDESQRLSDERKKIHGFDPIKDKEIKKYEKKTKKKHPHRNM